MILSDEQIKEIEERANKATSGPWKSFRASTSICGGASGQIVQRVEDLISMMHIEFFGSEKVENADFCISARTDIPALIQSHRELKDLLEKYKSSKKRYQKACGEKQNKIWDLEKELGRLPSNVPERVLSKWESGNTN